MQALVERVGWQNACVAMANRNVRILWAVMAREQAFDPGHVSEKPLANCPKPAQAPAAIAAAPKQAACAT